ncbi:hypothetical protein [Streptomyces phage phiScoe3]|nr:hypothetical protein [Streptomyces phage phiScoe3]
MANTPTCLYRGNTTTSLATVYTVPAKTTAIITNVVIANSGTTAATVLLQLDGFAIVPNTPVPANGIFTLDITQVLAEAKAVKVQASSTTVAVHVSGVEVA